VGDADGELLSSAPPLRVMIIPFHPNYYLSDADRELAEVNDKKPEELSRIFRYGLDLSMEAQVRNVFDSYSFLSDTADVADANLKSLYSGVTYKYQKPFNLLAGDVEKKDTHVETLFGKPQEEEEEKGSRWKKKEEEPGPSEYMNAEVRDPAVLTDFSLVYGVEYFVFLNQFELKTNYETCLDRTTNNFKREVLVHYSIYNARGEQLKGSVINVVFGSNDNHLDQIIGEYLPQITAGIQRELLGQIVKDPGGNN
jgi:hypothetical protein